MGCALRTQTLNGSGDDDEGWATGAWIRQGKGVDDPGRYEYFSSSSTVGLNLALIAAAADFAFVAGAAGRDDRDYCSGLGSLFFHRFVSLGLQFSITSFPSFTSFISYRSGSGCLGLAICARSATDIEGALCGIRQTGLGWHAWANRVRSD